MKTTENFLTKIVALFCIVIFLSCSGSSSSTPAPGGGPAPGGATQKNPSVSTPTAYPVSSVKYLLYPGDTKASGVYYKTYDSAGNVTEERNDIDNDGSIDSISTLTYDNSGNLTKDAYDYNADGTADETREYTYDAQGYVTQYTYPESDDDEEGDQKTITYVNTYDSNNQLTNQKTYNADQENTEDESYFWGQYNGSYYMISISRTSATETPTAYVYLSAYSDLSDNKTNYSCHIHSDYFSCNHKEKTDYGDTKESDGYSPYWSDVGADSNDVLTILNATTLGLQSDLEQLVEWALLGQNVESYYNYDYFYTYDTYGNFLVKLTYISNDSSVDYVEERVLTYSDGTVTTYTDADGDGYPVEVDCDDNSSSVVMPTTEICDDGVDNDCDGLTDDEDKGNVFYRDSDGDGYGDQSNGIWACSVPDGYVTNDNDCNDADSTWTTTNRYYYDDSDGDGYGDSTDRGTATCVQPSGHAANKEDCDDNNSAINPIAVEVCDDGLNNDCNDDTGDTNYYYLDSDADGYGDPLQKVCVTQDGYVADNTDCDDASATTHPNARDCKFSLLTKKVKLPSGKEIEINSRGIIDVDDNCVGGPDEQPCLNWTVSPL